MQPACWGWQNRKTREHDRFDDPARTRIGTLCHNRGRAGRYHRDGTCRGGKRRIIPIIGGHVSGPHFSGKVLNIGADWQTVFEDGLAELDTRYAFATEDGAVIEIINYGCGMARKRYWQKLRRAKRLTLIAIICAPMQGWKQAMTDIAG